MRTNQRLSPTAAAATAPAAPSHLTAERVSQAATATKKAEEPTGKAGDQVPAPNPAEQEAERVALLTATAPEKGTAAPKGSRRFDSVADLMAWIHEGQAISDRLTHFVATRKELREFQLGTDGKTDKITMQDGTGRTWVTTNSRTIAKVRAVLLSELDGLISESEAELREKMVA